MEALCSPRVPREQATPAPVLNVSGHVNILHPRNPRGIPLIKFPSFESPHGGVPLGVVLDACAIIADNRTGHLRLCTSPDVIFGDTTADLDSFVRKGFYLFIVLDENGTRDDEYSVCHSFRQWSLPTVIPERWKGPIKKREPNVPSGAVRNYDERCIVTNADGCLESAHLVPRAELAWFNNNCDVIRFYGGQDEDLDSIYNEVAVRADLNARGIDTRLFLFAPYDGKVVTIFTNASTTAPQLAYEHHFRMARIPDRILWLYVYIRFAFNIFKSSKLGHEAFEMHEEQLDEGPERPDEAHEEQPPHKKQKVGDGGSGKGKGKAGGSGGGSGGNAGGSGSKVRVSGRQCAAQKQPAGYNRLQKAADTAPDERTRISELALRWQFQNPQISAVASEADGDVPEEVDQGTVRRSSPVPLPTPLPHTLVMIVLDWTHPWSFVDQLATWLQWVDAWACGDGAREVEIVHKETRKQHPPAAMCSVSSGILGPGTLMHHPPGQPVIIACPKANLIDEGSDVTPSASKIDDMLCDQSNDWEACRDGAMQVLRAICLQYGASQFHTTPDPAVLQALQQYALHVLFLPPAPSPAVAEAPMPACNPFFVRRDRALIAHEIDPRGEVWERDMEADDGGSEFEFEVAGGGGKTRHSKDWVGVWVAMTAAAEE